MANKVRGEIQIELCGKSYTLKPEFEGMLEAEDKIGKPLPFVFVEWGKRNPSLREIAAVIYGGLLWDKDLRGMNLSFEEIGKMVVKNGCKPLMRPVIMLINATLIPPNDESDQDPKDSKKKNVEAGSSQSQSPGEPISVSPPSDAE